MTDTQRLALLMVAIDMQRDVTSKLVETISEQSRVLLALHDRVQLLELRAVVRGGAA